MQDRVDWHHKVPSKEQYEIAIGRTVGGTDDERARANAPKLYDCRDAFAATLERLAADNENIVAVCNDSVGSSKSTGFKIKIPGAPGQCRHRRTGHGRRRRRPRQWRPAALRLRSAPFLTGRALEQIKADIAYSNANVKLVGISSGMAYGELGPTHHSIEDFAWTRVLPNLPVIAPCDRIETAAAVEWAASYAGPCFLRLSRVGVPDLLARGSQVRTRQANLLARRLAMSR